MKTRTVEHLYDLCKQSMLEVLTAVQAGHPLDEEISYALIELWDDFLKAARKQGEPLRFTCCDVALVTIQATIALRKACKKLGHDQVPQDVETMFWGVLAPVLVDPTSN